MSLIFLTVYTDHITKKLLCFEDLCSLRAFLLFSFSPQISHWRPGWLVMCVPSICLEMSVLPMPDFPQTEQCHSLSALYIMDSIWASRETRSSEQ